MISEPKPPVNRIAATNFNPFRSRAATRCLLPPGQTLARLRRQAENHHYLKRDVKPIVS